MFEAVRHIDVDRKNSLPVADFYNRYLGTRTPVVFGDLTHRWPAFKKWNLRFFKQQLSGKELPIYSKKDSLSGGSSLTPVRQLEASEFFDLLMHDESDLHVRNLDLLSAAPTLALDFKYPRLGLKFKRKSPRLHIGGAGATEIMHYRADLAESFLCNFGGKQHVLLVRPEQAKFTYEAPMSFESLSKVDYSKNGLTKNPAISNIDAYYAELSHGDVLYIPSEYRYLVHYSTISFGFVLAAAPKSPFKKLQSVYNKTVVRNIDRTAQSLLGARWIRRKIRKAVRRSKR